LSSVADYQDVIPGLLRPADADAAASAGGGGAPPADARAALLHALAAAPGAAPRPADGWALLGRIHAQRLLPTGCDAVDELLHVGLREGMVVEVAGETSSGKTQLCLQVRRGEGGASRRKKGAAPTAGSRASGRTSSTGEAGEGGAPRPTFRRRLLRYPAP
jgi:hypothetical protein